MPMKVVLVKNKILMCRSNVLLMNTLMKSTVIREAKVVGK